MTEVLLDVRELRVGYGRADVVHGVKLRLLEGSVTCVVGANGAGKTTTLLALSGVVRPRCGSVTFAGSRVDGLPAHRLVTRGLVQVPEGRAILAQMSVTENLMLGAWTRSDRAAVRDDLEAMFERFPILRDRARVAAGSLSGGEQQLLAIARGLMARPRLLLLDEPSMGLAPALVAQIFAIVTQLRAQGLTILLIEQNARQALAASDRAYVMERGRIVREGPASELAADPAVAAAYLGGP